VVEDVKTSSTSRGDVKAPWEPRSFTESVSLLLGLVYLISELLLKRI